MKVNHQVPLHSDGKAYEQYYARQVGSGLPFYAGAQMQRGHGLGQLFGGLMRMAIPLVKRTALPAIKAVARRGVRTLKKQALQTGVRLAGDVAQGRKLDQAVKQRLKQAGAEVVTTVVGRKRRPAASRKPSRSAPIKGRAQRKPVSSRSTKRRKTSPQDIFG